MFPSKPPPPQRNNNPYDGQNHRLRRRSNFDPAAGRSHNLYYPKIYTYKCYGKFATSSIDTVNHGQCHGIPTKLETLYNEQIRISRIEALKRFTSLTADVDLDDYQNHSTTADMEEHGSEFNQQSVFLSPALIYKYDNPSSPNSAPNKPSITKSEATKETNGFEKVLADDILPEEELIVEQNWTCYGVTEVEYLALENVNTGESKIVAVAPQNTGISIREIETDDTIRTLTRCGLGWIDILHDSSTILVDDENESDQKPRDTDDSKRLVDESKIDDHQVQELGILPQLRIPTDIKASIGSMEKTGRKYVERTFEFSKVVWDHMKYNSTWLYRNLQDDFPSRTYTAGKSIVTQLPRSIELTSNAMSKILRRMFGSDDDGDDDDHYPPGGRRF